MILGIIDKKGRFLVRSKGIRPTPDLDIVFDAESPDIHSADLTGIKSKSLTVTKGFQERGGKIGIAGTPLIDTGELQ